MILWQVAALLLVLVGIALGAAVLASLVRDPVRDRRSAS